MITNSKLANQPDNKLTNKFRPVDMSVDYVEITPNKKKSKKSKKAHRSKPKWLSMLLLQFLLIFVAGGTFGIIYFVYTSSHEAVSEETSADESDESGEEIASSEDSESSDLSLDEMDDSTASIQPITNATSANPTIKYGRLMLINPNFTVEPEFIAARKTELISLESTYGIEELNPGNGDNLLDGEAAANLNTMLADYTIANPGHFMKTVSCFREVGTSCGRLCAATGASDHHTGLTCDLIDPIYGTDLDTDTYAAHLEWQWLKENSYKYGFIDRFPEAWAGGSMSEPINVNASGTTGLYETWHYRYVGTYAAEQIATGVYNNGEYDSLEHYLKARALVPNLLNQ